MHPWRWVVDAMNGHDIAYFAMGLGTGGLLAMALLRHRWKLLKAWQEDLRAREIRASKLTSKGETPCSHAI